LPWGVGDQRGDFAETRLKGGRADARKKSLGQKINAPNLRLKKLRKPCERPYFTGTPEKGLMSKKKRKSARTIKETENRDRGGEESSSLTYLTRSNLVAEWMKEEKLRKKFARNVDWTVSGGIIRLRTNQG